MSEIISKESFFCEKCKKALNGDQFYSSNNTEKHPNKKIPICKKCLTMHVNNWEPDTYLWIIQEADVPYIPEEWNKLMIKYAKDPTKVTGTTILGRYLAKMQLTQWKDYRWKDNEFLQQLANNKIKQAMKDQGYEAAEIAAVLDQATFNLPTEEIKKPEFSVADFLTLPPPPPNQPQDAVPGPADIFQADNEAEDASFLEQVTEEEYAYLRLKWGKTYRPEEWIALEQLYEEMIHSYDIQAAGDINTLKLACKCSLKANQLLDLGDIDGAQKATKMYETLMKSGKWTAAQNKADEEDVVDSVGELVALCEKDGFIPKYYTAEPQDHVDRIIEDLKKYTTSLVVEESGLGSLIESAVKQIEEEKERIKVAAEQSEEQSEDDLFDYDKVESVLEDEDFVDFKEFEEGLEMDDNEFLTQLLEGEEEDDI